MIYGMYANATATANSIASIDIQSSGYITGMLMFMQPSGHDALNDQSKFELSFKGSTSLDTNDVRGQLFVAGVSQQFLTQGGGIGGNTVTVSGVKIPIAAGERIHLHAGIAGGGTCQCNVILYVEDGTDDRPKIRYRQ